MKGLLPKYSYSGIKMFKNCPLAFYEKYYKNTILTKSHGTAEFGNFTHNILEDYANEKKDLKDLLPYYINNFNKKITSSFVMRMTEKYSKDFYNDYFESGKSYFETFEGFGNFNILEVEYEFKEIIDKKFIFLGKIDLVVQDMEGNIIIIDHKSKNGFKTEREKEEYAIQLYLYSYAIKRKYGRFPKVLMFNMFRKKEWVRFDFCIDTYNKAMCWLRDMVREIERCYNFVPNKNTFFCNNFCPFKNLDLPTCK